MSFNRVLVPPVIANDVDLTSAMTGIGMNFAAHPDWTVNIEDTLMQASQLAMINHDYRVFDVLVTWLETHAAWINVNRLTRLAWRAEDRVKAFWTAFAKTRKKDRRFFRLMFLYMGPVVSLVEDSAEFNLKRYGEDPVFMGGPVRFHARMLRRRREDVLSPSQLAKRHKTFHCRVLMGPSYRADMWALLDRHPELNVSTLARKTYGSYATAWRVRREWNILNGSPV